MDTNLENDQPSDSFDQQALLIAESITSGECDEVEGRWALIALIRRSKVTRYVVNRGGYAAMLTQVRIDVADALEALIERRVLEMDPPYLEISKLTKDRISLIGWARQFARSAASSEVRNLAGGFHLQAYVDPSTPDTGRGESVGGETWAFHQAQASTPTENAEDRETADAAHDRFVEEAHGVRETERLKLAGVALRERFSLPEIIRPESPIERERVRQEIATSEAAARFAAASMLALIEAVQTPEQASVDEALMALWDDYTTVQLQEVVDKPIRFAQTIALSTLSLDPKPGRRAVAAATAALRRLVPDNSGWPTAVVGLVNSWLASEAEAVSAYDRNRNGLNFDQQSARLSDALAWSERLEVFAAAPEAHLGNTAAKVAETVAAIVRSCVAGSPIEVEIAVDVATDLRASA